MDRRDLLEILEGVASGKLSTNDALTRVGSLMPREVGDYARVDVQRPARTGLPEAVFAEGKSAEQCARIAAELDALKHPVLVTRLSKDKAAAVLEAVPDGVYHPEAQLFTKGRGPDPHLLKGPVVVICAGTSDLPVAEEAALTLETIGQPVVRLNDVGVAGIHRLLAKLDVLRGAGVVIVAAGMEGALPSVVGGLVSVPVIALPTPVGYGSGMGGYAALLGMLNSCSPNISVVNVGNGFGAACVAALINRVGAAEDVSRGE